MNNRMNSMIGRIDNYIDSKLPQSEEARERRKKRLIRPVAIVALAATIFGGYKLMEHTTAEPTFSETTTTYTVEPGDGTMRAAEQVQGVASVDIRAATHYIENMPENTTVLEDGLQPGEVLVIPESVEK